jgi:hypothetical protein
MRAWSLSILLFAACVSHTCMAGEVSSPEEFLRQSYSWTIRGIDGERGLFGKFRNFACHDDRLAPPRAESEVEKRRWGTQCNTKRGQGENLAAMVFVTWVNKRHVKPVSVEEYAIAWLKAWRAARTPEVTKRDAPRHRAVPETGP